MFKNFFNRECSGRVLDVKLRVVCLSLKGITALCLCAQPFDSLYKTVKIP